MIKKGFKFDTTDTNILKQNRANQYADMFLEELNEFYKLPEIKDVEVDKYLHKCYLDILDVDIKDYFKDVNIYFSPSSANSCKRELYLKNTGASKDILPVLPHQTRWRNIGTSIGDLIQKDILLKEKHLNNSCFNFERTSKNFPMFEEFAYTTKEINFNGNNFHLCGTTDGILNYNNTVRVGLEIKSKQTTYSQTSYYSLKEADPKHIKQCVAYSLMYGVNYWIICYVNTSKKSWNMTEEDILKYPDIRTFGIYITDDMKIELLNYLSDVVSHINNKQIPKLDITKFTFNNYKEATILNTTLNEIEEIEKDFIDGKYNYLPKYILNNLLDTITDIKEKIILRGQK